MSSPTSRQLHKIEELFSPTRFKCKLPLKNKRVFKTQGSHYLQVFPGIYEMPLIYRSPCFSLCWNVNNKMLNFLVHPTQI